VSPLPVTSLGENEIPPPGESPDRRRLLRPIDFLRHDRKSEPGVPPIVPRWGVTMGRGGVLFSGVPAAALPPLWSPLRDVLGVASSINSVMIHQHAATRMGGPFQEVEEAVV
jgi:hypothetical protein